MRTLGVAFALFTGVAVALNPIRHPFNKGQILESLRRAPLTARYTLALE